MELLGYKIASDYPVLSRKGKIVVNTLNPHSYCTAKKDFYFQKALKDSDFLLPDGIGIVFAAKFLKKGKIQRIAGYDLFLNLMEQLEHKNGTCFFLGAAPKTLVKIKERVAMEYPNVKVKYYSPPYKKEFTEEDCRIMCDKVNEISPDVLFVGMTAPKQEKWVLQNKPNLDSCLICSIGAVFDFYAGTVKRAPQWVIKLGLEWLHRSLKNPKKLGIRNFKSNPRFIWEVIKIKTRE